MPRLNFFKDPEAFRAEFADRGRKHLVIGIDLRGSYGA